MTVRGPGADPASALQSVFFITHPDVVVDPAVPVPDWRLSERGRERMIAALSLPWMASIGALWSSTERKAREGAEVLANRLGLGVNEMAALGENDRSSTGYLPEAEFNQVATSFFASPMQSVRGWERAADAQLRIARAVSRVLARSSGCGGNIAIISHGAVGTLLLCDLRGDPIGREHDQPANNGGNYFAFEAATRALLCGWTPLDG